MRFEFDRQKRPSEELRLSIDFAQDVSKVTGDSIVSIVVKAYEEVNGAAGADVTSSQILDPLKVGTVGYATFYAGTDNKNYLVNMTVTTALGFIYEHDILVPVRASA